jgi:SAM-dependent methyltransferase
MRVFGEYANHYDALYADKDYVSEADFVSATIRRYVPDASSILDLGCGSARHALALVNRGFSVFGIERSAEMLVRARERVATLPADLRQNMGLAQADICDYVPVQSYDAVTSLFHVLNYQLENDALSAVFRTARAALRPNGIFIFDFWYGPAVLTQRPALRVKRARSGDVSMIRIAEPVLHSSRCVVDVNYTIIVRDEAKGIVEEIAETHSVRYLFLPEIELVAKLAGIEIVESGEWLTGRPLSDACWSGYCVGRVIA